MVTPYLKNLAGTQLTVHQLSEREAAWHTTRFEDNPHINHELSGKLWEIQRARIAIGEIIIMGNLEETITAADKTSDY